MMTRNNQSVNVDRIQLIEVLKKGRDAHVAQFKEATVDYKNAVRTYLIQASERVVKGDFSNVRCPLNAPVSREKDYTDIIEMLEVSVDPTITLDRNLFRAYYHGEWDWSRDFSTLALGLKESALAAATGAIIR